MSYKRMQLDVSSENNFRNKVGQILVFFCKIILKILFLLG